MADIVTPIPTGAMIPQEYQDQIDEARRKQVLANALMARSMNFQGPAQVGPQASKISPLGALAAALQGGFGGYLQGSAAGDESKAKSQFQADESADRAKMLSLPEDQQPAYGYQSKFPMNQHIAGELQKQLEARRQEAAKIQGTSGDTEGAMNTLYGRPATPMVRKPVEYFTLPDANDPSGVRKIQMKREYDKYGRPTESAVGGSQVTVNLPNNEAIDAKKSEQTALDKAKADAVAAQGVLATNEQIVNTLQQGASTGGLAGYKQSLRKVMLGLGVPASELPESGPTDIAKQLFGKALAEHAKTFGSQPTEAEDKRIAELVGTIDTDPSAIPQILAMNGGKAIKQMQDFKTFLDIKRNGQAAKTFPGLFDTADVGVKMPEGLNGPDVYQMQVLQALKQYGGDVTKLQQKNPLTGKMEPIPADAKFDIQPTPIQPRGNAAPGAPVAKLPASQASQIAVNPQTGEKLGKINGKWVPVE